MAKFQTEIQNEDAIRLGSCKVEIAPYDKTTPVYVELGAARNVKLAEQIEIATIAPDNAPPIRKVKDQTVVVSCEWMEPTLTGLAALRGAIDTVTSAAGEDTFKTGGKTDIGYVSVRLTNTNAAGKTYQVTIYKAQITKGLEQAFSPDADLAAAAIPLEFTGVEDSTKTAGEQLFEIVDMQAPKTPKPPAT